MTFKIMGERRKIFYEYNNKIRIKITDKCNLSCPFCHSEGTRETEAISLSDVHFTKWLKKLKPFFSKVHLTGGEPSLYDDLPSLCKYLKLEGYDVFLTTNLLALNQNLLNAVPYISRINISFHTFNPVYFKFFLNNNESKACDYLSIIRDNILKLKREIKDIAINTVVSHDNRKELEAILLFCQRNKIALKLVPDWRYFKEAREYIFYFLRTHGFIEEKKIIKFPGSNLRVFYRNKDHHIEFKDIMPYYLDFWCHGCKTKDSCIEKFAFLRLEGNPLRFKPCISRQALSCDEFEKIFWPNYRKLIIDSHSHYIK